jgi:membrane protease YdiL (CAAX protease family)
MPEPRARALLSSAPLEPLPALSPWARVRDGLRFALRPAPYAQRHPWSRALVAALAIIFALDLAIDSAAMALIEAWDTSAGFLPAPLEGEGGWGEELFYALLLAPLLEEALYRGWLSGRAAALRFAAFGFAAEACFIGSLWAGAAWEGALAAAGVAIALAGFVQWLMTRERDTAVPAWFTRHFAALVWASSLLFAAIHLGNYETLTHPLGLLVVTPQLIGGLCLAYVRTRLGLRAAIAHHAAYNALFLAGEWWAG